MPHEDKKDKKPKKAKPEDKAWKKGKVEPGVYRLEPRTFGDLSHATVHHPDLVWGKLEPNVPHDENRYALMKMPAVYFTQDEGMLHAFSMPRGKSEKEKGFIYTADLQAERPVRVEDIGRSSERRQNRFTLAMQLNPDMIVADLPRADQQIAAEPIASKEYIVLNPDIIEMRMVERVSHPDDMGMRSAETIKHYPKKSRKKKSKARAEGKKRSKRSKPMGKSRGGGI